MTPNYDSERNPASSCLVAIVTSLSLILFFCLFSCISVCSLVRPRVKDWGWRGAFKEQPRLAGAGPCCLWQAAVGAEGGTQLWFRGEEEGKSGDVSVWRRRPDAELQDHISGPLERR